MQICVMTITTKSTLGCWTTWYLWPRRDL